MSYWHQLRAVLAVRPEDRARDRPRLGRVPQLPARRRRRRQDARHRRDARASTTSPTSPSSTRRCPPASRSTRSARSRCSSTCRSREFETCLANIARARQPARVHLAAVSRPAHPLRRSGGATTTSRSATSSCCRGGTSRSPSITGSSAIRTPRARSPSVIARHLDVVSRGFIRENPYHYMWQLRPRAQCPSVPEARPSGCPRRRCPSA